MLAVREAGRESRQTRDLPWGGPSHEEHAAPWTNSTSLQSCMPGLQSPGSVKNWPGASGKPWRFFVFPQACFTLF